jgi:hypothetical protein
MMGDGMVPVEPGEGFQTHGSPRATPGRQSDDSNAAIQSVRDVVCGERVDGAAGLDGDRAVEVTVAGAPMIKVLNVLSMVASSISVGPTVRAASL